MTSLITPPSINDLEHRFQVLPAIVKRDNKRRVMMAAISFTTPIVAVLIIQPPYMVAILGFFVLMDLLYLSVVLRQVRRSGTKELVIKEGVITWIIGDRSINIASRYITAIIEKFDRIVVSCSGLANYDINQEAFTPEDYEKIRALLSNWDRFRPMNRRSAPGTIG